MAKILLVEDDPLIRRMVEMKFHKEGFEVISCIDGKEGLEKLGTENPDVVLTDLMMPYVSGLEIITAVKSIKDRDIPVILFSTMGQEHIVEEAFNLGADDYINKPFSVNELTIRIRKQLKRI